MATLLAEQPQVVLASEHASGVDRRRLPTARIGTAVDEGLHHIVLALEHRPGERCLSLVVRTIDIGTLGDQGADCGRVSVIGRQHHQRVTGIVVQIHGDARIEIGDECIGVTGACHTEQPTGEFGYLGCCLIRVVHETRRYSGMMEEMSTSKPEKPTTRSARTVSASVARRALALVAVGAVGAAAVTLLVTDGFDQPEKITTHSVAGPATTGPVSASSFGSADPGTCLQWTPTDDPETDRQDLAQVSCAEPHRFEVAKDVDMSAYPGIEFAPGSAYPGAMRFSQLRDEHCIDSVVDYLGTKFDPNGKFSVGLMFPSQTGWATGERTLRCGVQQSSNTGVPQEMTGSVLDQDQSSVWDVGTCIGINQNVPSDPVECSQPHAFEAASVIDLQQQFQVGIPNEADQDAYLEPTCTDAVNAYLGSDTALRDKTLTLFWSTIDVTSWLAGSRQVTCSIGKELDEGGFATITGSATGDILINGQPPVPPPAAPDGRALPTPLPGAAPITPGG